MTTVGLTATPAAAADRLRTVRWSALAAYGAVVVWSVFVYGVPVADDRLFVFAIAGLLCACIGRTWREVRHLLVDWVPFAVIILGYDYSRGWAHRIGVGVHFQPQITGDRLLFAGHVPTEWLQRSLYSVADGPVALPAGGVRWWEVIFQLVYVSHFVVWIALAALLWVKSRARFQWYARRLVTLAYLGFVTYVLFPAAPPWLAAEQGYLPATVGRFGRGLDTIGLKVIGDLITDGAKTANPVAAIPSLHFGFALLVAVTLWRIVPQSARMCVAAYPAMMGVVLVVTGEHYVVDLVIGGVYVALACHLTSKAERWWRARESERPALDFEAAPAGRAAA